MRLISRRLNVTGGAGTRGAGDPPPDGWLGSTSPGPNVMRRLLFCHNDRSAKRALQVSHFPGSMPRQNRRIRPPTITNSLNGLTLTPNFGQSPVTLAWDKAGVASRPGPVRD